MDESDGAAGEVSDANSVPGAVGAVRRIVLVLTGRALLRDLRYTQNNTMHALEPGIPDAWVPSQLGVGPSFGVSLLACKKPEIACAVRCRYLGAAREVAQRPGARDQEEGLYLVVLVSRREPQVAKFLMTQKRSGSQSDAARHAGAALRHLAGTRPQTVTQQGSRSRAVGSQSLSGATLHH